MPEGKVGPRWTETVLADGTVLTADHQSTFSGFAEQAHTLGLSVAEGRDITLFHKLMNSALEFYRQEGFTEAQVTKIEQALTGYELLAVGLPMNSPLNHLGRKADGEYDDTTLAALDPAFGSSGLAADLVEVLGP